MPIERDDMTREIRAAADRLRLASLPGADLYPIYGRSPNDSVAMVRLRRDADYKTLADAYLASPLVNGALPVVTPDHVSTRLTVYIAYCHDRHLDPVVSVHQTWISAVSRAWGFMNEHMAHRDNITEEDVEGYVIYLAYGEEEDHAFVVKCEVE